MPKRKQTQSRRKALYRGKNSVEYEKALVQRGSVASRLSDIIEKVWSYAGAVYASKSQKKEK